MFVVGLLVGIAAGAVITIICLFFFAAFRLEKHK